MTPLAMKYAKQLVIPLKDRCELAKVHGDLIREALTDVHCFETTAVLPLIGVIGAPFEKMGREDVNKADEAMGRLVFLPAPKTWIEYRHPHIDRIGYLLSERGDWADVELFYDEDENGELGACYIGQLSLVSSDWRRNPGQVLLHAWFKDAGYSTEQALEGLLALPHFFLIAINSPRIVGRQQHMPHRALEKSLLSKFGVGKFPLHAWTEIKLEIAKPADIDDGEPHEAHLTGKRALHFCRKHIRIRRGQLEYVKAHWRGDPALGIKRSRYILTPPSQPR